MRRALLLLAASAALSCYRVDTPSGRYLCDPPDGACPPGQACIEGRCRSPGDDGDGGTPAADGEGGSPTADGEAPRDMAGPCPAGGILLARDGPSGRDVHACLGRFAAGKVASVCGAGYRACATEDGMLLSKAVMAGICDTAAGFYAAQIEASLKDSDEVMCPAMMAQTRALVGCGREVRADDGARTGTISLKNDCQKLKAALPCDGTVRGWSCTQGVADAANSNAGGGGALCCKMP